MRLTAEKENRSHLLTLKPGGKARVVDIKHTRWTFSSGDHTEVYTTLRDGAKPLGDGKIPYARLAENADVTAIPAGDDTKFRVFVTANGDRQPSKVRVNLFDKSKKSANSEIEPLSYDADDANRAPAPPEPGREHVARCILRQN